MGSTLLEIGYVVDRIVITQDEALESICYRRDEEHFRLHSADLSELVETAKVLRNTHAERQAGVIVGFQQSWNT